MSSTSSHLKEHCSFKLKRALQLTFTQALQLHIYKITNIPHCIMVKDKNTISEHLVLLNCFILTNALFHSFHDQEYSGIADPSQQ